MTKFQDKSSEPRAVSQHPDNAPSSTSRDTLSRDTGSAGPSAGAAISEDERKLEDKIGDNIDLFKSVFADSDSEVCKSLQVKVLKISYFLFNHCSGMALGHNFQHTVACIHDTTLNIELQTTLQQHSLTGR